MARCHINDEALTLARDHTVERFGHDLVMVALNKLWPDLLDERHEAGLRGVSVADRIQSIQDSKYLPLLCNR